MLPQRSDDETDVSWFVDRAAELARFEQWLTIDSLRPPLLHIVGPPGMGKSALLHAMARYACSLGWAAILVTPSSEQGAVNAANHPRTLLLFDAGETRSAPEMYLSEAGLSWLGGNSPLVIAGGTLRSKESGPAGIAEGLDVESIPLDSLAPEAAREYLRQRGLTAEDTVEAILQAVGGYPLGLVRAADLALQWHERFVDAPVWPLVRRQLVTHWLRDIEPPSLIALIEASALVHRFDQDILQDLLGTAVPDHAFDDLWRLNVVRVGEQDLALHSDLRRLIAADLHWRRPVRYAQMRQQATEHYGRQFQEVPLAERERLVVKSLYLCEISLIHRLFFDREAPEHITVRRGTPHDHGAVQQLWTTWVTRTFSIDPVPADESEELQQVLDYPGTRLRIAVNREKGTPLGFTAMLPVCAESLDLIRQSHIMAGLLQAAWNQAELEALPASPDASVMVLLHHMAWSSTMAEATIAALLQDAIGVLAGGGIYLASAAHPGLQALLEALGFRRIDASLNPTHDPAHPVVGYELDLSLSGVEGWIDALRQGRWEPPGPRRGELERDVQNVLARWQDDAWLAWAPLGRWLVPTTVGQEIDRSEAVRQMVRAGLARAQKEATADGQLALRAVEWAYLSARNSHPTAMAALHVSRATFYRLVKRGIALLAAQLWRDVRSPSYHKH